MRRRLALAFAAVTAMVVLAFVIPLAALVQRVAEDRALNAAQQLAAAMALALAAVEDPASRDDIVRGAAATTPGRLSVLLPDGTVLGAPVDINEGVIAARAGRAVTLDADSGGKAVLVPVIRPDGTEVIRVLVPDGELRAGVARAWTLLAVLAFVLVGVAVVVGDRLARSLVRPIRDLAGVAAELGEGNLDARVAPSGPPEIVEVANAQNRLAARIVSLLAAEREAAADLSHRLRTPITALRLEADNLRDPDEAARVASGVDALTRAVNQVIADARRTDGGPGATSDLAAVTAERAEFWSALADEEGRSYRVEVPDKACTVAVPTDDLEAVLDALLGNVLAHTPAGTPFAVSVVGGPDAPARLVVEDDGPGVAAGAEVRGVSAGGSTGLGLDIVRRTAERSGGGLTIGRSASGGARIEVTFGR